MIQTRILHIIQHLKPGGIEQLVFSMLCANVQNVYILALELSPQESFSAWPKLKSFSNNLFFAEKKQGVSVKTIRFITNICSRLDIATIHTHHIGPLIYGYLATKRLSLKHVHTEHDVWHLQNIKNRIIQHLIFRLAKNISLVAVSHHIYTRLKAFFPKMPLFLIYNAIDTNRYGPGNKTQARRYFKLPLTATVIGSAGHLYAIKGHTYLIEAMQSLPENYYLIIAGTGYLEQTLLSQIHQLNLTPRVFLLGMVENMRLFYEACDVFCLPSLNEGLPLVLLEAQACQIPVVCSDVGSCIEAVDPNSGFLVPPKNAKALKDSCLKIKEKNGHPRDFILNKFNFKDCLTKYNQLYKKE